MKKLMIFILITSLTVMSLFFTAMAEEEKETFTRDFWVYQELDDGTVMIIGYTANENEVAIPAELDGKKVTAIRSNPFKSCYSLRAIYSKKESELISSPALFIYYESYS